MQQNIKKVQYIGTWGHYTSTKQQSLSMMSFVQNNPRLADLELKSLFSDDVV